MSSQIKAGAALSYVIIAINIAVGVLYTPYMLRALGQSEYGLYSLAASVIAYLTILDLGFGNAIIRYTAKFRAQGRTLEQEQMLGMFLKLYLLLGVVALGVGALLVVNVDSIFGAAMSTAEVGQMRTMLILMSANMAITLPLSIFGSVITAYENFVFQRVVSIVRILLNPLVMVLLLALGYKAVAMVVVTTIFNVVTLLINRWYCLHRLKVKIRFGAMQWGFFREVSVYSFWILLNVVMDRVYGSAGQFVLGIYRDVREVAIYSIAVQLKDMFYLFSTAIMGVFLPRVTQMVARGETTQELSRLFIRTGRLQYLIISTIMVGFILLGEEFIVLWAGEEYRSAYLPTLLLFAASVVPLVQNLGIIILQAQNRMQFRSLLYLFLSLASVAASIPLAIRYGGLGCAVATAVALVLGQGLIINVYYARNIGLDIVGFWREIGRMSIVPALAIVGGLYIKEWIAVVTLVQFGAVALGFMVLYVPLVWLFMMKSDERAMILNFVKR